MMTKHTSRKTLAKSLSLSLSRLTTVAHLQSMEAMMKGRRKTRLASVPTSYVHPHSSKEVHPDKI